MGKCKIWASGSKESFKHQPAPESILQDAEGSPRLTLGRAKNFEEQVEIFQN